MRIGLGFTLPPTSGESFPVIADAPSAFDPAVILTSIRAVARARGTSPPDAPPAALQASATCVTSLRELDPYRAHRDPDAFLLGPIEPLPAPSDAPPEGPITAYLAADDRCAELDPQNTEYRHLTADVALEQGDPQLAFDHLMKGYALEPLRFDWEFMLGRATCLLKDHAAHAGDPRGDRGAGLGETDGPDRGRHLQETHERLEILSSDRGAQGDLVARLKARGLLLALLFPPGAPAG